MHLGCFEEAVDAFEQSRRLTDAVRRWPVGSNTEVYSLAIAALCLGVDLRSTVGADEIEHRQSGLISLGITPDR